METQGLPSTKIVRYFGFCDSHPKVISNQCDIRPPVGLRNLGSTCWFNVAVQLLYHIPRFRQLILEFETAPFTSSKEVVCGLQELFISIMYSERKLIDPSRAVNSIGKLLGAGQQDTSEFLGVVLNRIREISAPTIENLFIGSSTTINSEGTITSIEEFMQYNIHISQDTTLVDMLELSLMHKSTKFEETPSAKQTESSHDVQSCSFISNLPSVFIIELCRQVKVSATEYIKSSHRLSFPSLLFMDRFLLENSGQTLKLDESPIVSSLLTSRAELDNSITSFQFLQKNITQLDKVYEHYQETVRFNTDVDFERLRALNLVWNTEIESKINDLRVHSKKIEQQLDYVRKRELPTLRPYQLHAVIVHYGQSNSGHYCIYVWDAQQSHWYQIDDTTSQQVSWDTLVESSFGGVNVDNVSAHCLVYIDSSKSNSILDLKEEYDIGPTDVLRYLKDHTDVRTRHSSYGKSQSMRAVLSTIETSDTCSEPSVLLFRVLDSERRRIYSLCESLTDTSVGEEERLIHFCAYLVTNKVDFEPFIYWSLLQHFSCFPLLVEEKCSRVCTAARRTLAFVECSTTQEQKKLFIQWNTAYYQFRLIVRHIMNGITNVFISNFSAAVPLALKALYLHHCLTNSSLKGPAMSVNSKVIHSLIRKSVTALSEELLESDIESVGEIVCSVLFDAIINWCEYADSEHLEAARLSARQISDVWSRQVKHCHGLAIECNSAFVLQTLTEIQRKLDKVDFVLNKPDEKGNPTPFDFKGHIPECPEDGEKLASKWRQMWSICTEQRILDS